MVIDTIKKFIIDTVNAVAVDLVRGCTPFRTMVDRKNIINDGELG